jgi:hypothetical protein
MATAKSSSCVTCIATLFIFAGSPAVAHAQQPPSPPAHDMQHMQHDHGFMHEGMQHAVAKGVKLEQQLDSSSHTISLRIGPMTLPANTNHMAMPQPRDLFWSIPMDGWLLGYTPRLVDGNGGSVPGLLLHHTAFWNTSRSDFLCPNKEEHIFGAGGELTNWAEIPGYGYRVQKGDTIRIETMVHNPTPTSYDHVYLEVKIPYAAAPESGANASGDPAIKSVYPAWMDVQACGSSGYDLKPGENKNTGTVSVRYDGILLAAGGHMHDYAQQIVLQNVTRNETVLTLNAKTDDKGQLLSMPVVSFFDRGGYKFAAGDQLRITATYDNTTGKQLHQGAMGIVVGYFLPTNDSVMSALRRKPKTGAAARQVAAVSRDH